MVQHTRSTEFRAIRNQMHALLPPPSAETSVREWFAGLALMNPVLMSGVSSENRVTEAVRLADELVRALRAPRAPTLDSMRAPSDQELVKWEKQVAVKKEEKERQTRATCPDIKKRRASNQKSTLQFTGLLPPPPSTAPSSRVQVPHSLRPPFVSDTRYMLKGDEINAGETVRPASKMKMVP